MLPSLRPAASHCDAFVTEMWRCQDPLAGNFHLIGACTRADNHLMPRFAHPVVVTAFGAAALTLAVTAVPAGATVHHIGGTTCYAFPPDNYWHADVSRLPVDRRSATWLAHMSPTRKLHPDFGPSYGAQPVPYGIPITFVTSSHAKVGVSFTYSSESDHVGYPLGSDTQIEGGANASGDRHAVIVDKSTCRLYELWNVRRSSSGRWTAGSGATWSLGSDALRPAGWTSADAAGLPILPGLLRYGEVEAGLIDHAIRFTTNTTSRAYLWPARHQAGSTTSTAYPPMGARFRLKASYRISPSLRGDTRAVLQAMKTYGLVLADNGSPWYFQGTADTRWPSALLDQLKQVPASAFEAVNTASLEISANSARAR
jgi:hypothetical protein